MKKYLVLSVASLALYAAPAVLAAPANVTISGTGFNPQAVTIEAGESVTWRNTSTAQRRVVVAGTQCNLTLQPNQSSSCTFDSPGTLNYSDPGESGSGFRGTITVERAPNRNVTIEQGEGEDNIVTFGGSLTLNGVVSSEESGEQVTIVADPLGVDPPRRVTVTTRQGGEWSLRVQPRVRTSYMASWRGAESRVFNAYVRPRVTLRRVGRNRFTVTVIAADSFAGKQVIIRRQRSRTNLRLVIARRLLLRENPRTETISQRTFVLRVPRGFRLRATLPAREAAPAYLGSQSNLSRA
jgi:plastocyanin